MLFVVVICSGCEDGLWACQDGKSCIKDSRVCDGLISCQDGSDEWKGFCALRQCRNDEWRCLSGQCIKTIQVCDDLFYLGKKSCSS